MAKQGEYVIKSAVLYGHFAKAKKQATWVDTALKWDATPVTLSAAKKKRDQLNRNTSDQATYILVYRIGGQDSEVG